MGVDSRTLPPLAVGSMTVELGHSLGTNAREMYQALGIQNHYTAFLVTAGGWSLIVTLPKWTFQIRSPSYDGNATEPDLSYKIQNLCMPH